MFDIDYPGGGEVPVLRAVPEAIWSEGTLPKGTVEAISGTASRVAQAVDAALRQS